MKHFYGFAVYIKSGFFVAVYALLSKFISRELKNQPKSATVAV